MADEVIKYLLKLEDRVSGELKKTSKQADELARELGELKKKQQEGAAADAHRAKVLAGLKTGFAAAAAAVTAFSAASIAATKSVLSVSSSLEDYEAQLTVLLGSAEKAEKRLETLFEIGSSTPFELDQIVAAEQRLVSFGVNADEVRGGVMDLVGALGGDLPTAALAIGKSFAAGKGASDGLRESYALLFQDVTRRAEELGGSKDIDNWRNAIVAALTDVNGVVAGGTSGLAKTFSGQLSNLSDQWFKFKKKIGDAGLFDFSKMGLDELLKAFNESEEAGNELAEMMSRVLISSLDGTIRVMAVLAGTMTGFAIAIKFVAQGFQDLVRYIREANVALLEFIPAADLFGHIPGAENFALNIDEARAALEESEAQLERYNSDMDVLIDNFMRFGRVGETMDEFREKFEDLKASAAEGIQFEDFNADLGETDPEALDPLGESPVLASEPAGPVPVTITNEPGAGGGGGAAEPTPAEQFLQRLATDAEAANTATNALAKSMSQLSESEQLSREINSMKAQMGIASFQAQQLGVDLGGPEMQSYFGALQDQIDQTEQAYSAALEKESQSAREASAAAEQLAIATEKQAQAAKQAAVGGAMSAGADFMSSGGLSALSAAGPVGAGAASLIGVGQAGDQAFDAEVAKKASESAKDRQKSMKDRRDAMREQGYSKEEIEAAGLGDDAITEAGKVTEEDKAAAAEDTDRGEMMAETVKAAVQGVIDGIKSLLVGLPDILSDLIPMLLIDLPTAIIESIPELVEKLIPVLLFELPKAIILMLVRVVPKLLKMLFMDLPKALFIGISKWWTKVWNAIVDLFSFGFQTGGYVPKTSSYMLHQGERVVPASGAGSGTATQGLAAFTGGSGPNVTINTNVVDPDSLLGLSRLINDEMGPNGRATVPIWGATDPVTSI